MQKRENNIFLQNAIAEVPRLLSQINRNPTSRTYGSCDRAYWHYRTNDISCSRYQETALTLTLIYLSNFSGNPYYNDENILEWVNASLHFTVTIQRKDGSFDEWYLNEGSFVATSFVTASLARVLLLLGREKITHYDEVLGMLRRAADWIVRHEEKTASNQLAGSICALYNVYLLTKNEQYKNAAYTKKKNFLSMQNKEGWWSEYGGPDIGYLSLTIDYLSRFYKETHDKETKEAISKAIKFITYFLHPNLTTGGEYMARNTEYLIPSGFALFSDIDENARVVLDFTASSLDSGKGVYPGNLDDRYLCYILYNWIDAGLLFREEKYIEKTEQHLQKRQFDIFFPNAGIRVLQNDTYYFVANLFKGGAFRVYTDSKAYFDSGIMTMLSSVCVLTSHILDYSSKITNNSARATVHGFLKIQKEPLMKTPTMIIFKTFQWITGSLRIFQQLLKRFLRKKMITDNSFQGTKYERQFFITPRSIKVIDCIFKEVPRKNVFVGTKSSHAFIPSSKYYTTQEVDSARLIAVESYEIQNGKTQIIRKILQ